MQSVHHSLCTRLPHLPEGHVALEAVPHSQHFAAEWASPLSPIIRSLEKAADDKKRSDFGSGSTQNLRTILFIRSPRFKRFCTVP